MLAEITLILNTVLELVGAALFASQGTIASHDIFPIGADLEALASGSGGQLVCRVAGAGLLCVAVSSLLALFGPRPVPMSTWGSLTVYHAGALFIMFLPESQAAFKGDLGGMVVHGGMVMLLIICALSSSEVKEKEKGKTA